MKKNYVFMWFVSVLFLGIAFPVSANEAFHITYQQENVIASDGILTGSLIINIVNTSGQDVKDVAVSIPGPNNVTYDNHQTMIGDVADGNQAGVNAAINAPVEMQNGEAADKVIWNVEFTNGNGERQIAEVTGVRIQ